MLWACFDPIPAIIGLPPNLGLKLRKCLRYCAVAFIVTDGGTSAAFRSSTYAV